MNFLAKFFFQNYKFTIIMTLFVMLFGVTGTLNLNSETFPSVNIGAVVVTTVYPGATAEDIETKITKPIEEEIQKVSGLKRVKSTSQAGISTIVTEVDIDNYPVKEVVADLQRAADRASGLPADLLDKPRFTEIKSDEFPVIELAVVGSNEGRLRDRVVDQLREDLKDNKKISSIQLSGFKERRFNIYLDLESLRDNHVSIEEVQAALLRRNVTIPAGELKGESLQKLVRIEGKAKAASELEEIVIRSNFSGNRIQMRDVARIEDGEETPSSLASYEGKPATFVVIAKKGGADILDLTKEVEGVLATYAKTYEGQLEFKIFSNEGVRVGERLSVLISNGWQGIVLVIIFLLIFLPGRVGLVTAISLPLALAATMGYIHAAGYSLNTITIIALIIAIGMLVDNAVVISENFTRLRDEGLSVDESLLKTIRDLWAPVTATGLTTIAAFLPMMVTTGVLGQFIKGIPIVVSVALLLSLAEGFFFLPTRLKLVGYHPKAIGPDRKLDFFDRFFVSNFESLMQRVVKYKWITFFVFTLVLVGTGLVLAKGTKVNLFPSDQTEIYVIRVEAPKGTRIERTATLIDQAIGSLRSTFEKEALHIVGVAGSSTTDPGDPKGEVGSNVGVIRLFVNKETQDTVLTQDMLKRMRAITVPDVKLSFEALVNGPPVGDPVSVTFRSNNAEQLANVAETIKARIAEEPGIFDAKIDDILGDDEITLNLRHDQLARLGLSLQSVGVSVRTAVAGSTIGDVNLLNRKVDYFLQFDENDRADIANLSRIKVSDYNGNLIPLSNLADLTEKPGAPQIKRYDFRRAKTVTANLDDSVITSIKANAIIKKKFEEIQANFPDVSIIFGGEAEKTNESVASLANALVLSLIGIFALMVLIFRSYLNPFIIVTTIPLGLTGVSLAFWLQNIDFSFMALIGVIGLGGIIVNSGIILISFIEQMRQETTMSLEEILVKASAVRLRSVLVTSLTTISGLVPTAYGIGGKDFFIIPMAMALAWGLTTGTIFTLLWVPPAYAIVEAVTARMRSLFRVTKKT
jgi:multidrug efflux pump subunit AcrB